MLIIYIYFPLDIGILIIRMYALYERSRKVLALYIIVGVVMLAVDCVSLNLDGNNDLPLRSIADSIAYSGWR